MHAFVRQEVQAIELLVGSTVWMAQVRHQRRAPRFLDDNAAGLRIGVTGVEHRRVEHRVEQGVAMNSGAMVVGECGGFSG